MTQFCPTFRSSILKACALLGFIVAAPFAGAIPAHAQTPNQLLYLYSGLFDNGGAGQTGVASTVHCSNFSGVTVIVQFLVFNFDGSLKANVSFSIPNSATRTASTHATILYTEDQVLNTGSVNQGFALVVGSSLFIVCTAQVVDAAAVVPNGIALHGIRYTPIPGTQE